jgi:PIN domain nuclease of toxin-antitoxin system
MSVILDTHAMLWALSGDAKLSKKARQIYDTEDDLAFSVVSLWEIGIKLGLQRQDFSLAKGWWQSIPRELVAQGVRRLDVEADHCRIVAELPMHHRDPFDRMLIAQAMSTGRSLLSIDAKFDDYPVRRLW